MEGESHNIEKTRFLRLFDDLWTFTGHGRASAASSTQGLPSVMVETGKEGGLFQ